MAESPAPRENSMPDTRAGWGGRPDDADRVSGGSRRGPARASGSFRAFPGVRAHGTCRCARARLGRDTRLHPDYGLTMRSISTRAPRARPVTPTQVRPGRRPALKYVT